MANWETSFKAIL